MHVDPPADGRWIVEDAVTMTPTQARVSALCARILGVERVGLDDNLFELGSDSHQAVLVALEIESVFDVSLPLEVMESTASARALAEWVDARQGPRATPRDEDLSSEGHR